VKPAVPLSASLGDRHNFDAPSQPVDANLKADAMPRDGDRASARRAIWKEFDYRAGSPVRATLRQQGFKGHIGRKLDGGAPRPRAHGAALRVERRRNRDMASNGGVAVTFQQSGDVNGVTGEPRRGRGSRDRRQDQRGKKPDDPKRADGFDKSKSGLFAHWSAYRDALLIKLCGSPAVPAP
jgi:hypothetical protein